MSLIVIACVITLVANVVCIARINRWWREGQAYYEAGRTFYNMAENLMLDIERTGRR